MRIVTVVLVVGIFASTLEFIQIWIPTTIFDWWDILWSWAGVLTAAGLFKISLMLRKRLKRDKAAIKTIPGTLFIDQSGKLGGAELFLADIALTLNQKCKVVLFEPGPFKELLDKSGIPVSVLGEGVKMTKQSGMMGAIRAIPASVRILAALVREAMHFDVLYANTAKAFVLGSLASVVSHKPLVYHLHDIISASHFSRMNRWLLVFCANYFATKVIANSEASKEAFILAGYRKSSVEVVYNGFDAHAFHVDQEAAAGVRREYCVGEKPLCILVGRITPWKGQHVFIEALSRNPDWHGLVVGDALFTDEDQQYARELREKVRNSSLEDRIHFTGFQLDLRRFYSAADVVVHCSVAPEPFGRVIVESMLYGKPVIATSLGGVVEILKERVTGLLTLPNDANALSDALRFCRSHPEEIQILAERGKNYAKQNFSLSKITGQLQKIIQEVFLK